MKKKTRGILIALLMEHPDVVVDILQELKKCKKSVNKSELHIEDAQFS